ncbi:MAG: GFA family protein [Xanthobacteraceae bacterium]
MRKFHEGGCLCGDVRYKATTAPLRVTICHCSFCQRFTGSAFLVEPIFRREDVEFTGAAPRTYDHRSDSSHKRVTLNFCGRCATTLYLSFERFPDVIGLCGGTFDDPNWFDRAPEVCRHIFTRSAQKGVVLPAGLKIYAEHALQLDGTANKPVVLAQASMVTREE